MIAAAGLFAALVLVFAGLRPDPLLLARELASAREPVRPGADQPAAPADPGRRRSSLVLGLQAIRQSRMALLAVAAVIGAHAVMVGVMSMTPLHLQELLADPDAARDRSHSCRLTCW